MIDKTWPIKGVEGTVERGQDRPIRGHEGTGEETTNRKERDSQYDREIGEGIRGQDR